MASNRQFETSLASLGRESVIASDPGQRRRYVQAGELLAIRYDAIQKDDRGAFFWLFAPATAANEYVNGACVVRVNGPLDYHDEGGGESYESIVKRIQCGLEGDDEHEPASCIVLRIDSPGGVVAGLDQTVRKIRKMSADSGVPIYAYVDETAYSAGFALCCAASEIYLPSSGFLGSIGVISTMVDQTKADTKMGLRFVILTSGARKADGHPHVPITDAMIAEEAPRVAQLAKQFYGTVKRARGISSRVIQSWEAKRFLGSEATRAGLADGIASWDQFMSDIHTIHGTQDGAGGQAAQSVAQPGTRVPYSSAKDPKMLAIDALIARREAAIKAEKDPAKLVALFAELEAAKKTKKMTEEEEESAAKKDEEDEASASSAKKSKGDETDRNDDEDDDEEDDDEDDDEDGAKKGKKSSKKSSKKSAAVPTSIAASSPEARIAAVARRLTGKDDPSAVTSALEGMLAGAEAMQERMAVLEKRQRKTDRETLITKALASKRISPHEAKTLATHKLEFVEQVIAMRPAGSMLVESEKPQFDVNAPPETALKALPESVQKQLKMAEAHAKAQGFKNFDPAKIAAEALAHTNGKAEV